MTNVAWRNLSRERTRLAISVGGVAFAVLLILLLRGLYAGVTAQATAYIRGVDADVWVAEAGTPGDFFHSVSRLPVSVIEKVRAVPEVTSVTPLVGRPVVFTRRGKDLDLFVLGIDPRTAVGAAKAVEKGRRVPKVGEIVVDRVFARNNGIHLHDKVEIQGHRLAVVGIARGGNAVVTQFGWTALPELGSALSGRDVVNYLLVSGRGQEPRTLARTIRDDVAGTKPMTAKEFADKNTADLRAGFLPIIWVLVIIAFVIGTAVIGLTIYTATLEKRREYGVLKAIGFSNRRLLSLVFQQAIAAGVLGLVVGVAMAFVLGAVIEELLPQFSTSYSLFDVVLVTGAGLAMSGLSSLIPMRPVITLDPAQVFRV